MSNTYAVIMAGGSGTRFWPLSRRDKPKQLQSLGPQTQTLLAATVDRIAKLIPPDRTYVVTSETLADATRQQLPQLPDDQVLAEPSARNTAPCIGWAAAHIQRRDPNGVLAVLPADHYISDIDNYLTVFKRGVHAAEQGDLVTIGIKPTRAETGYGYIEMGEEIIAGVHNARRFVEKPNRQRAEQFLSSGRFLWNSGMFFFRANVILEAIKKHLPGLGEQLAAYDQAASQGNEAALIESTYHLLPAVSIDHGVMEKAESVAVLPGAFAWSDLGSWTSAWELADKDDKGNVVPPDAITIDTSGSYARTAQGKLVAMIGVQDLVVVDTEDALLVMPKDRAQEVRAIVDALRARDDTRR